MRELMFRVWHDGHWLHDYESSGGAHLTGEIILFGEWLRGVKVEEHDTLCIEQYTGRQIEDGTHLYEGDIVQHDYEELHSSGKVIGTVEWDDEGGWVIGYEDCDYPLQMIEMEYSRVRIIGNIHENPELLEAENGL